MSDKEEQRNRGGGEETHVTTEKETTLLYQNCERVRQEATTVDQQNRFKFHF